MLRSMLVRVAVLVVLLFAMAASSALAAEPVPVPPALQALEQKMLVIHFNTARVSACSRLETSARQPKEST